MRPFPLAIVLALVACHGCEDAETRRRKEATRNGQLSPTAAQTDHSIQPVYPSKVGAVPALVTRVCDALHGLPKRRKAECCETTPGVVLTDECTRNLTGALADGSVELSETSVAACEAAMASAHRGCDWVGPWSIPPPKACRSLLVGKKNKGDKCRSNLECAGGMRCVGAGPTDTGKCGPSSPNGGLCGTAVDTLAVYVRADDLDESNPPCADGWCDRNICRPAVETGGACTASVQCKDGRCIKGACVAGSIATVGESCSGGECEIGARCVAGTCMRPKASGESCTRDGECNAACEGGVCTKRCVSPAILRGIIKTPKSN